MAVYFTTRSPKALLTAFKGHISEKRVTTWEVDDDGDLTHTNRPWEGKAWMIPSIEDGRLAFYILHPRGSTVSTSAYAVYHGRLAESMLRFCDNLFTAVQLSSYPEGKDKIGTPPKAE